jgi:hypothetical protein
VLDLAAIHGPIRLKHVFCLTPPVILRHPLGRAREVGVQVDHRNGSLKLVGVAGLVLDRFAHRAVALGVHDIGAAPVRADLHADGKKAGRPEAARAPRSQVHLANGVVAAVAGIQRGAAHRERVGHAAKQPLVLPPDRDRATTRARAMSISETESLPALAT